VPFTRHEVGPTEPASGRGRSAHPVDRYRRVTCRRCYVEAGDVVAECVEQVALGVAYVVVSQSGELPAVGGIACQGLG
jgi:hypothetical protein